MNDLNPDQNPERKRADNLTAVLTLACKDLRLLARDKVGMFFTLGFPLLMAIMFGYIFGGMGSGATREPIPIALVDLDATPESAAFVKSLSTSTDLRVTMSASAEDGRDAVRRRKQTACIVIQPGFGLAAQRPFWGDPAKVSIGVDPSRYAEAGMVQGIVLEHAFRGMQKLMGDPAAMRSTTSQPGMPAAIRIALDMLFAAVENESTQGESSGGVRDAMAKWQPVVVETESIAAVRRGPPNSFAISFPQGLIWGLLGCAAGFGISLVTERTGGTLTRLRLAPLSRGHILAGKATACFLSTCAVATILLLLAVFVFKVIPTSVPWLIVAVLCSAIGFVGIMMLLSVIGRTEASAGGIGWAILTMMAMFGGGMVPAFIMPRWMQTMSMFSPVRWSIESLEGALWRGYGLESMWLPCSLLIAIGVVGFAAGAALMKRLE